MSDEEFVRSKWERAEGFPKHRDSKKCCISLGGRGFTRTTIPDTISGYAPSEAEVWSAARAFTEARLEEIRQVEQEKQEIVLAITEWSLDGEGTHQSKVYARILARTEAHLADLKRGMKP